MSDDPDEPDTKLQSSLMQLGLCGRDAARECEASLRLRLDRACAAVGYSKRHDAVLNATSPARGGLLESLSSSVYGRFISRRPFFHQAA